jgi:hypothetical protein
MGGVAAVAMTVAKVDGVAFSAMQNPTQRFWSLALSGMQYSTNATTRLKN